MGGGMRANGKVGSSETADVVIIGGGVNGLATAFQLAKRGVRKVVVLERRQLGAGATGKSGALVRCHYANIHEAKLTLESLRIFRHWGDEVGHGDSGFDPIGFIQVASVKDADHLRANVAAQQAIGVDTHLVDAAQLREIEPLINADDLTVAAWEPHSGYADPNATLYGFAAAAEARGVSIRTETPAREIVRDSDRVAGVRTPDGTIATASVLVAAGSWANELLAPLDLDWGMQPVRTQVAIFRWPREIEGRRRHPVIIDAVHHSWLRPEGQSST
ncbi:MAG TPA: FAD-binding oxidoreductase, partial [Thermomicrobiales bacterium]|nr:FAD-binding oxidoreductase [Thermomicrobiales bacterium]